MKITRTAIMRERSCETCRAIFLSRSSKKRFCDDCLIEREREADRRRALAKLRLAGARALGSSVTCQNCEAAYILTVGPSKFCEPCTLDRYNRWQREKRLKDPKAHLSQRMSRAVNLSLKVGKEGRSWRDLVPYSLDDLMRHIERQFLRGMSWDNRGEWHIDHIVPVASFTFSSPDDAEFKAAWALTNLRPMWARENQRKSDERTHLI